MNDYLDATLWGDYYQDLQWIAHSQTRYQKRYKWSGEINSSFLHTLGTGSDRWDFFGRHFQTLGPGFTLTGQGNFVSSKDYLREESIGRSVLLRVQRNLNPQVSLNKSWGGSSMVLGLLRNQDLDPDPGGRRVQQQLPSASFSLNARPIGHLQRGKEPAFLPWLSSTVFATGFSQKTGTPASTAANPARSRRVTSSWFPRACRTGLRKFLSRLATMS